MIWKVMSQTVTASGDPQQFFNEAGEEVFLIAYEREGGGGDSSIPRRVVGTDPVKRAAARLSANRAIRRYDRSPEVLPHA